MKTFEEKWTAWLDGELSGKELVEFEASTWWTVRRLFLTGVAALALFVICAVVVIRDKNPGEQSQYLTQILNARVDPAVSPNATISMFETKEDKVTVLWVEGLQSLPADYAAK